jgi:hypothetical protein
MQDHFLEEVVVKHRNNVNRALYMLSWVVIVLSGFTCAFMFSSVTRSIMYGEFHLPSLLFFLASGGICAYTFFFHDKILTEYEYTFTNGTLDFARVFRAVKRQELGSMNVRNVTACGHVAHESFQRYLSMKDVEKKNWFLNRDGNLFYFYYVKDNKKHMIIIEPSEEMVEMIRKCVEPGVFQG